MKEKLFSVTKDDFDIETFRAGGKGGQKQNKTESGVRIRHRASGAVAESREYAEQSNNRKAAFQRLIETTKFKSWLHQEASRLAGRPTPEQIVEEQMCDENLRIETREDGKWQESLV
jgi:protein subunit release factor B